SASTMPAGCQPQSWPCVSECATLEPGVFSIAQARISTGCKAQAAEGWRRWLADWNFLGRDKNLANLNQPIAKRPARPHLSQRPVNFFFRCLGIRPADHQRSLAFCCFQQFAIAKEIGHAKARNARLLRPEKFPRPAQLEIQFRDLE